MGSQWNRYKEPSGALTPMGLDKRDLILLMCVDLMIGVVVSCLMS